MISSLALVLLWVLKVRNPIQFVVINTLNSMGLGLNGMLTWAYIGDVIDDQEVKTGIRQTGTVYSYIFICTQKSRRRRGGGLGAWSAGAIGYISSSEAVIVQTESVKNGIYNCMTILPAVCYLGAFLCLGFHPPGKKKVEENARILAERRAAKEQ